MSTTTSPKSINEQLTKPRDIMFADVRTPFERFQSWCENYNHVALLIGGMMAISLVMPLLGEVMFLISMGFFLKYWKRPPSMPFRVPLHARAIDSSQLHPGTGKPQQGEGIIFLGNESVTLRELWITNSDARTHMLMYGSTGSGKTFFLTGLAVNTLITASGYCYVDGKADNELWARKCAIARFFGREDDILLINFMTGGQDFVGKTRNRMSNTTNPFASGGAFTLTQFMTNLMSEAGGGDTMWRDRSINYVDALLRLLVFLREHRQKPLSVRVIRRNFTLEKTEALAFADYGFTQEEFEKIQEPLQSYVENVPGYKKNPAKKQDQGGQSGKAETQTQNQTVYDQHGYITMQLTRAAGMLTDTYGHIIGCDQSEVDWHDLIINRRLLIVMLPTLEKSPEETESLGKIIVSMLKSVLATIMGTAVEGEYLDIVETKPTKSESPFLIVLDEYGYYSVKGFANIVAQARSLGLQLVFASQDHPSLQKSSKEEAEAVVANCNVKVSGRLEDPRETFEVISKSAGDVVVAASENLSGKSSGMGVSYRDEGNRTYKEVPRLSFNQLKGLNQGEFYFLFQNDLIKGNGIKILTRNMKTLRVNKFVEVMPPDTDEINEILSSFEPPPPPPEDHATIWRRLATVRPPDTKEPFFLSGLEAVSQLSIRAEERFPALAAKLVADTVEQGGYDTLDRGQPQASSTPRHSASVMDDADPLAVRAAPPGVKPASDLLEMDGDGNEGQPPSLDDMPGLPSAIAKTSEQYSNELDAEYGEKPTVPASEAASSILLSGLIDTDEGGGESVSQQNTLSRTILADMLNDMGANEELTGRDEKISAMDPDLLRYALQALQKKLEGNDQYAAPYIDDVLEMIEDNVAYKPETFEPDEAPGKNVIQQALEGMSRI